ISGLGSSTIRAGAKIFGDIVSIIAGVGRLFMPVQRARMLWVFIFASQYCGIASAARQVLVILSAAKDLAFQCTVSSLLRAPFRTSERQTSRHRERSAVTSG